MIGRLRGEIEFVSEDQLLIDVRDVGYLVNVPVSTATRLADGSDGELLIYTQVREDAILLYGFATAKEKQVFELLISVSGVGPKLALSVLSTLTPDAFCQAILQGNLQVLTQVPGIGKRTGERLLLELKDKVAKEFTLLGAVEGQDVISHGAREAQDALLALGYSAREASDALAQLKLDGTESAEVIIRKALSLLVRIG
ncbi:MAG: Holliday junction branch migration protein RuvA [Firmicutes bacterium]|nr:Holliday junction branch migration protein RuvA [Bacillota bacterium]